MWKCIGFRVSQNMGVPFQGSPKCGYLFGGVPIKGFLHLGSILVPPVSGNCIVGILRNIRAIWGGVWGSKKSRLGYRGFMLCACVVFCFYGGLGV